VSLTITIQQVPTAICIAFDVTGPLPAFFLFFQDYYEREGGNTGDLLSR
jgi:hypothetical protein